jgi:hypothetical protein
VVAFSGTGDDELRGSADCAVKLHDDLSEVIECLAIEAMLAACEPSLLGDIPHRSIVFKSNLRH